MEDRLASTCAGNRVGVVAGGGGASTGEALGEDRCRRGHRRPGRSFRATPSLRSPGAHPEPARQRWSSVSLWPPSGLGHEQPAPGVVPTMVALGGAAESLQRHEPDTPGMPYGRHSGRSRSRSCTGADPTGHRSRCWSHHERSLPVSPRVRTISTDKLACWNSTGQGLCVDSGIMTAITP